VQEALELYVVLLFPNDTDIEKICVWRHLALSPNIADHLPLFDFPSREGRRHST